MAYLFERRNNICSILINNIENDFSRTKTIMTFSSPEDDIVIKCLIFRLNVAEIVISGGMSVPQILTIVDKQSILSPRVGKFDVPQV